MTLDELKEQITEICPSAAFETDSKGQIIVVTNFFEQEDDDELLDAGNVDDDFDFNNLDELELEDENE